jgi:hypothetical protein
MVRMWILKFFRELKTAPMLRKKETDFNGVKNFWIRLNQAQHSRN